MRFLGAKALPLIYLFLNYSKMFSYSIPVCKGGWSCHFLFHLLLLFRPLFIFKALFVPSVDSSPKSSQLSAINMK